MSKVSKVILTLLVGCTIFLANGGVAQASEFPSVDYMKKMGFGWNLGNTFDGFDLNQNLYEESWGNPQVTDELIHSIKEQGFTSIRLPFSVIDRQDESNKIDSEFLNRYTAVVKKAEENGLYVMINLHHDSWEWLQYWDGNLNSKEYQRYLALWQQLADHFKDFSSFISFESINEPLFNEGDAHKKLQAINKAFYQIVRNSGGNNSSRMLILPTLITQIDQNELDLTANEITSYQDENILATVHYYSEWAFSNNMGITNFDEPLYDDSSASARTSVDDLYQKLSQTFLTKGIGVVIGEYGLLGYDRGDDVNELGELVNYVAYMSEKARETGISLMLWDNGQHFDRHTYQWKVPYLGQAIQQSMQASSSYSPIHDKSFITKETTSLFIPIKWQNNSLEAIQFKEAAASDFSITKTLTNEVDYQVVTEGIVLSSTFLQDLQFNDFGYKGQLLLQFNQGASWIQELYLAANFEFLPATGIVGESFVIPIQSNGQLIRRAKLVNDIGEVVSTNSWWKYLTFRDEFYPNYEEQALTLPEKMTHLLIEGTYFLTIETFAGTQIEYKIVVDDNQKISGASLVELPEDPTEPNDSSDSDSSSDSTDTSTTTDSKQADDESVTTESSNSSDESDTTESSSSSNQSDTTSSSSSSNESSTKRASVKDKTNNKQKNLPQTGSKQGTVFLITIGVFISLSAFIGLIIRQTK